ncbi:hypothetical protein B9Z55_027113 [Caenorhabditis nigoni]|uniref:DUF7037 domain-containing protein n=1 Tax=Caenorhabditis nigoni TaxID=1611254 RepID=A0A2G5SJB0_9PELO|nr:hypothetical protein B9Z55_027113 [Caenorhabditis nigoni]
MRNQIQNAAVFEEVLKNLKLFFDLARRRLENPKNENKRRTQSPRQVDYFSKYYDWVMMATIWIKKDVLNCIQMGISEYKRKDEPIEDYLGLFMIISNMIRCFYTLEHGLVEMDVVEDPPKLGQLYDLFEDVSFTCLLIHLILTETSNLPGSQIWVENLRYHSRRPPTAKGYGQKVQIPGMVPVLEIPQRPRGQVGGVVGLIKAKYNPNGTTLFEVVDVYKEKVSFIFSCFLTLSVFILANKCLHL